jgi:hypothetical protein
LIPDTIKSGSPLNTCVIARLTQSVGVPSTAKMRSSIASRRNGCRSVRPWPTALASWIGATIVTSPNGAIAAASARMPSER